MINAEAEVSKYKNCKNRDELLGLIKHYKNLALQHATNLNVAGQYSKVALKLQEICDKLPAPKLINQPSGSKNTSTKTVTITDEEHVKIDNDWKKKAKK